MVGLVIDIETTGWFKINPATGTLYDNNEILEVGYIRVNTDTKEILSSGTLNFYKPYFAVESEAQDVHHITREYLEQFKDSFDTNLVILNSLIQQTCIIGKNSERFDYPYIKEFINKHSNGILTLDREVTRRKIELISGGYFGYETDLYHYDVQNVFASKWKELEFKRTGVKPRANKKGTLTEYIETLGCREEVDKLYNSLPKTRETRAHGALYDTCMTYFVWKYCTENC